MPFEKAKLAFCLEDKIKQNGFPLGEEEITHSEKGVFIDIFFFFLGMTVTVLSLGI